MNNNDKTNTKDKNKYLHLTKKQKDALRAGLDLFRAYPSLRRSAKEREKNEIALNQFDGVLSRINRLFEQQRDPKNPKRIYHRKRFLERKLPRDLRLAQEDVNLINGEITKLKWRKSRNERLNRGDFPFTIRKRSALNNTIVEANVSIKEIEGEDRMARVRRVNNNFRAYLEEIATRVAREVKSNLKGTYFAEAEIKYLMEKTSDIYHVEPEDRKFTHKIRVTLHSGNNVKLTVYNLINEVVENFYINSDKIETTSSGWTLVGIEELKIILRGIINNRGKRYFELPQEYFPPKLFKNIKNRDNFCLLWCIFYQLLITDKFPYDDFGITNPSQYNKIRAYRLCESQKHTILFTEFFGYVNKYITEKLDDKECYDDEYDTKPHLLHLNNLEIIEDFLKVKIYLWKYNYSYKEEDKDSKGLFARTLLNTRLPEYNYETDSDKLVIDLLEVTEDEWESSKDDDDEEEEDSETREKHFVIIPRVEALTNLAKNSKTGFRTLCRQCGVLLFPQFDEDRRVCMTSDKVLEIHLALTKEYRELNKRCLNPNKRYEELGIDPLEKKNEEDEEDDLYTLDPSAVSYFGDEESNDSPITEAMRNYLEENREHLPNNLPEDTSEIELIKILLEGEPDRNRERMKRIKKELESMGIPKCESGKDPCFSQFEQKLKFNLGRAGFGNPEVFTNLASRTLYPFTCFIDFESYQQKVYLKEKEDIDSKALSYEYKQKPYQVGISFSCIKDEDKFIKLLEDQYKIPPFMVLSDNCSKTLVAKMMAYIIHARWIIANKIYPQYKYEPCPELREKLSEQERRIEEYEEEIKPLREKYEKDRKEVNKELELEFRYGNLTEGDIKDVDERLKREHEEYFIKCEPLEVYKEELGQLKRKYEKGLFELSKSESPGKNKCFFCCRNVNDVYYEMNGRGEKDGSEDQEEEEEEVHNNEDDDDVIVPMFIIDHFAEKVRLTCARCNYYHNRRKNLLYDNGLIVYAHNLRGYDGKVILKEMNPRMILEHLLEMNNGETGDLEIPDKCVRWKKFGFSMEKCDQTEGDSRCVHCYPNINSYTECYNLINRCIITNCRSKSMEKIDSFEILHNIRFKDTLDFTLCSLDAFVKNITAGKSIEELRELFYKLGLYAKSKGVETDNDEIFQKILMSKGSFPYEFCRVTNNKTKILDLMTKQTKIPDFKYFGKDLSDKDKESIQEEWELSKARNLLEYSDFYCIKDVLLLEACFNLYRKQVYNLPYGGLDMAKTETLAALSRNIRLKLNVKNRTVQDMTDKTCKELLSTNTLKAGNIWAYYRYFNSSVNPLDEKMYNMVNRSIKGGVSSVLQTRVFDQDLEPEKVCMQIDVNSLYPSTYLQDMPLFPIPIKNGVWTITKQYKEDDKKKMKKEEGKKEEEETDKEEMTEEETTEEEEKIEEKIEEEEKTEEEKEKEENLFTFEYIIEAGLQCDPMESFHEYNPLSKIVFPEGYQLSQSITVTDYLSCGEIDLSNQQEIEKIERMSKLREELSCAHLFINEWRLYKDSTDYQVYERHLRLRDMMFSKPGSFLIETKLRIPTDIQESINYMKKFGYPKKYISKAMKLQVVIKRDFNNNLHEFFHTLPPFPAHKTITYDDLSNYNKEIIMNEYLKSNPEKDETEVTAEELRTYRGKSSKLVYSFETQDEYVLYNNFLKFLVTEMFVIPEYLYSFVKYETGELMKEFAETLYNARLEFKKKGNNDMQYVMKILLNSAFGRTCMDDSKYAVKREFVNHPEKARARFSRDDYLDCSIIHEDLVLITRKKPTVTVSNGRHIGSFILDSAKVTLMRAVTEMRKKLGKSFETIYTDTDSLFFKIEADKFDELFSKELIQFMDVGSFKKFIHLFPSKYSKDDPIFEVNAGKLGCFSLEDGIPRYKKVIALAAKQYLVEEWKEKDVSKRAVKSKSKGVRTGRNANPKLVSEDGEEIDFIENPESLIDVYQSVLKDKTKRYDAKFDSFRSYEMQVYNVSNFKVGIKAYCDKNLIQDDGVTSYFYGQQV